MNVPVAPIMSAKVLIAGLLLALPAKVGAANLLSNPGLEQGTTTAPTYWATWPWGGGNLSYLRNQVAGNGCYSGSRAVSIQGPSPFVGGWYNTNYVPVVSGQVYRVHVWVKTVNFSQSDFAIPYLEESDSLKAFLNIQHGTALSGSSTWREITDDFTITDPAVAFIRVLFVMGNGGSATVGQTIFDDASLELIEKPIPPAFSAIEVDAMALVLAVTNLSPGATNSIDRASDPNGPWTEVESFAAVGNATNWSWNAADLPSNCVLRIRTN